MKTKLLNILLLSVSLVSSVIADAVEPNYTNSTIKAEFEDGGGGSRVERSDASGGATILLMRPQDQVEVYVLVEESAQYYLRVAYRHRGSPARLSVVLDGKPATEISTSAVSKDSSLEASTSWDLPLVIQCLSPIKLFPGPHAIKFVMQDCDERFGCELDCLFLSKEKPALPQLPIAFELERAGNARSIYRGNASGFATLPCSKGDVIKLPFTSAGSGGKDCEVLLYYSNDGGPDRIRLEFNGKALGSRTTRDLRDGPPGSGWNPKRFDALHFGPIVLPSGEADVRIRIEDTDEFDVELDKLELRLVRKEPSN